MFRKLVKFVICKEDVISVIDALSAYGTCKVVNMKDGKHYLVSLYCEADNMRKFMDTMFALNENGVSIHAMDILTRL